MNDPYSHRHLALLTIIEELPNLLPPDEAEKLSRQVEEALAEDHESALTRAAAMIMQTPARECFQELLSQDQETLIRTLGLHGNPLTPDTDICYLCSEDGGHHVSPDDVEEWDAFHRAICPVHHVIMQSEKPCSMES